MNMIKSRFRLIKIILTSFFLFILFQIPKSHYNNLITYDEFSSIENLSEIGDTPSPFQPSGNHVTKGVSNLDNNRSNTSIVNYNISSRELSYENFDKNSYRQKYNTPLEPIECNQKIRSSNNPIRMPTDVFGDDDRIRVTNPKSGDYLKYCFIRSNFCVINHELSEYKHIPTRSTGFLVGPNLLLTAAHCVYDDLSKTSTGIEYEDDTDNPKFAISVECYFGSNTFTETCLEESYLYYAKGTKINIEYSYYLRKNFDRDWAVVELDRNIGDEIGYFDLSESFSDIENELYSFGYPAELGYGMFQVTGNLMETSKFMYHTDMDATAGQSGSPLFYNINDEVHVIGIINCGTINRNNAVIIDKIIYNYVDNFYNSRIGILFENDIDYLEITSMEFILSSWYYGIQNNTEFILDIYFSNSQVNLNDARFWQNSFQYNTIRVLPYETGHANTFINIEQYITTSYIKGSYRYITYLSDLNQSDDSYITHNCWRRI